MADRFVSSKTQNLLAMKLFYYLLFFSTTVSYGQTVVKGKVLDKKGHAMPGAYAAQIRLAADAMNRWQKYGALFTENIDAAKAINADNPRIYYLEGSSLFFKPEEYGGGKKVAKPLLEKSVAKFSTFKPQSSIAPQWGKMEAEWMLSQANL